MGMESIKLAKPWLEYGLGDTVEVDPLRAEWLRDNGYELAVTAEEHAVHLSFDTSETVLELRQKAPEPLVTRTTRRAKGPFVDLEAHPPVADLPTPNQDPIED